MTTFTKQTFANEEINVDGNQYTECTFDTVVLIYQGGDVPVFTNCTFRSVKVGLQGAASQTAGYLNSLYEAGLPKEVEQVMQEVQTGAMIPAESPEPPPPVNVGENYQQILVGLGIMVVVFVWFLTLYVYGTIIQPTNTLENGDPLRRQVDFALIPVLPDTLADEYDALRETQLDQLGGGQVTTDGTTTVSIDVAKQTLLQQGFVVGSEETETETDNSGGDDSDTGDSYGD